MLTYVDEESHKATSKYKKHVFDMCVCSEISGPKLKLIALLNGILAAARYLVDFG